MSYRSDLEALGARHDALAAEVATKTKELDAARQLLDDAKERAKRPVLPNIRVATPCSADWNQMTGDEQVRACAACNKNVYNLSSMTRDEAEALIVAKEGRLCVRYFQRSDGTILLKDCAIGVRQKRKRRLIAAGAAALLAGGGLAAYKLTRAEPQPSILMREDALVEASLELTEHVSGQTPSVALPEPESIEMLGQMIDTREVKGKLHVEPE